MRRHVLTPAHYLRKAPLNTAKPRTVKSSMEITNSMLKSLRWSPSNLDGKRVSQSMELPNELSQSDRDTMKVGS